MTADKVYKVYAEMLFHFSCPNCQRYWTFADIPVEVGQEYCCPHCNINTQVGSIQNGQGQSVKGVGWLMAIEDLSTQPPAPNEVTQTEQAEA